MGVQVQINKMFYQPEICRENIYKYCDIGTLLALRATCKLFETIEFIDIGCKTIEKLIKSGDEIKILCFLKKCKNFDFTKFDNLIFKKVIEHGYDNILNFLLKWVSPPRSDTFYFCIDPTIDNNFAIKKASECGHDKIVKILLEWKPPIDGDLSIISKRNVSYFRKCDDVEIIKWIEKYKSIGGHMRVIKRIANKTCNRWSPLSIQNIDPASSDNEALKLAQKNNHFHIVTMLQNWSA